MCLSISPHLNRVATLPCEIRMSENLRQSEICIVINSKSQDKTDKHLSCGGLLHYKCITKFAGERIFKIGEVTGKMVDRVIRAVHLSFVLKDAELAG